MLTINCTRVKSLRTILSIWYEKVFSYTSYTINQTFCIDWLIYLGLVYVSCMIIVLNLILDQPKTGKSYTGVN